MRFRKGMAFLLALLLMLSACSGTGVLPSGPDGGGSDTKVTDKKGNEVTTSELPMTVVDYPEVPRTGRLVIYTMDTPEFWTFTEVVQRYKMFHSSKVDVELQNFGTDYEAFYQALADNPPDVFTELFFPNGVYSAIQQGKLADLTPLFATDFTYDPDKYNQQLLEAGQFFGQQLIVPMNYKIPYFYTAEETVWGTDLGTLLSGNRRITQSEFIGALLAHKQLARKPPLYPIDSQGEPTLLEFFLLGSGLPLYHPDGTVDLRDEAYQKLLTDLAALCQEVLTPTGWLTEGSSRYEEAVATGKALLLWNDMYMSSLASTERNIAKNGATPLFLAMPGAAHYPVGIIQSFLAVNAETENLGDAYDFIRYVMDEPMGVTTCFSVSDKGMQLFWGELLETHNLWEGNTKVKVKLSDKTREYIENMVYDVQTYILPDKKMNEAAINEIMAYASGTRYRSTLELAEGIQTKLGELLTSHR